MLLIQALVGGLTAALAAWVAARTFSAPAGFAAGALVALDPALLVFAAQLHSLTFDAFANVCLVAASVAMPVRARAAPKIALGVLFGLCALTRATALLLLPLHLLWLNRYRAFPLIRSGAVLAIVAIVVYSPWPIRNTIELHQLTFGSSETTEWLWRGNNPNANGASLTASGQRMIEVASPEFRMQIQNATEAERVGLYRDAALAWITANPASALRLYAEKLVGFWWGSDSSGILYPSLWLLGYRLWFLAILIPAVYAAWRALGHPDQRPTTLLILATLVAVSAIQAVFYVEGRHRIAVEPLLLIVSGAGFALAVQYWRGRAPDRSLARMHADS
jgi:4-amino-4-deoxy-L-arabinose transferase-like glycosyltransferase